jgi:hypothetical protein
MMFWGGDYRDEMKMLQQKRTVQFKAKLLTAQAPGLTDKKGDTLGPVLEFQVTAGPPLRSRLLNLLRI